MCLNGIDHGRGETNINLKTGIRFGVIPTNDVDYWNEESEPYYPCESCDFQPCEEEDDHDETPDECEYFFPLCFIPCRNCKQLFTGRYTANLRWHLR